MYDKHIIVRGQSSTALHFLVDAGTKLSTNAKKMDTNRVSTIRRSMNQLEIFHGNKPPPLRDANGFG